MTEGRLLAIFVKRFRGGPMDAQDSAVLEEGRGIAGNADRGGKRQVTLVARERWDELMAEVGADLPAEARRGNLVLSGIDLADSRGRVLAIGGCRLRIGGETRPCEQMEAAATGLQAAMRKGWGGGAFAEIVTGGTIAVGDEVRWVS